MRALAKSWLLPIVLPSLFLAGIWQMHRPQDLSRVEAMVFESAEFRLDRGPDETSWRTVTLAHDLGLEDHGGEPVLYRVRFDLEKVPDEVWSVYLPRASQISSIRINEHTSVFEIVHVRDLGLFSIPSRISLPLTALVPGTNTLTLEARSWPRTGLMSRIAIGATRAFDTPFAWRYFFQITLLRVVSVGLLILCLFLVGAWLVRPRDTVPAWLAAGYFALNLSAWNPATIDMDVFHPYTLQISGGWILLLITILVHRILDLRRPRIEYGLFALAIVGSAIRYELAPAWFLSSVGAVFGSLTLALGIYPLVCMLMENARRDDPELPFIAAAGMTFYTAMAYDVAIGLRVLPRTHEFVLAWGMAISGALYTYVYFLRYARALQISESLSEHLEERVKEKETELTENYAQLATMERERAVQGERERMVEEIHDGMGGRITSALAMIRTGRAEPDAVSTELRRALEDMRLMIHSLDAETSDVASVLGLLRDAIEPGLHAAGISLEWDVAHMPEFGEFGPEGALNVARIVQEGVSNAIKHSGATTLAVRAREESGVVSIAVEDNGVGLAADPPPPGRGRGLAHMRRRAERIGGEVRFASLEPGFRVELRLGPSQE